MRMRRNQSLSFQDIAAITGTSSNTVNTWWRAYQKEVEASLTCKKRGWMKGDQCSLIEARVQLEITDKMLSQGKRTFA